MRFCVFGTFAILLIVVAILPWSDVAQECHTAEKSNDTYILEAGWTVDALSETCLVVGENAPGIMLLARILYCMGCVASYVFLYRCLQSDTKPTDNTCSTVGITVLAVALCSGSLLSWHLKLVKENWQPGANLTGAWILGILIALAQLSTMAMQIHNLWQVEHQPPTPYQAL